MPMILLGTRSMDSVEPPRTKEMRMSGKVRQLEGCVIDPSQDAPYNSQDGPGRQPWSAAARVGARGAKGPRVVVAARRTRCSREFCTSVGRRGREDHDRGG